MNIDAVTLIPYFAYGSNLDGAQMRKRCAGARVLGRMVLPEHSLAFVGRSKTWNGHGVGTVVPEAGQQVEGLAYALTPDDWVNLDRAEGYPRTYERRLLSVLASSGESATAQVYVHTSRERGSPSLEYLELMRAAYASHGFDAGPLNRAASAG